MSGELPAMPGVACADPLDGAVEIGSIGYYDGPLTTVFRRGEAFLLATWAGGDNTAHRWMVLEMSRDRLRALGDGALTFRALLTEPESGEMCLVDHDGDKFLRSCRVVPADIDARFLPDPGVTFPREEWHDRAALMEAGL